MSWQIFFFGANFFFGEDCRSPLWPCQAIDFRYTNFQGKKAFHESFERFLFPPNFWVVSIRILNGLAGHGRSNDDRPRWPNQLLR